MTWAGPPPLKDYQSMFPCPVSLPSRRLPIWRCVVRGWSIVPLVRCLGSGSAVVVSVSRPCILSGSHVDRGSVSAISSLWPRASLSRRLLLGSVESGIRRVFSALSIPA